MTRSFKMGSLRLNWKQITSLLMIFGLLFAAPAMARRKKKKKKMDPNKGQILVAGMVYAPGNTMNNGQAVGSGFGEIQGATVKMVGTDYETTTNKQGMFFFTAGEDGPVELIISKPGYKTERRTATIDRKSLADSIRVKLLREGSNYIGDTPTGPGTLYVAYSARVVDQTQHGKPTHWDPNLQTMNAAIAAGADPLTLEGNDPRGHKDVDTPANPTTNAPNSIMIFPPNSPGNTGFHNTSSSPYWLCFDLPGRTLYVADSARRIQVLDAANKNQLIANLPVQGGGLVTALSRSAKGSYIMAPVMASTPGIMMIDTKTKVPLSYLTVDGVGSMIPTYAVTDPGENRVFLTLDGQGGQAGKGLLVALDPYTGVTMGQAAVGSKPTCVAMSLDGRHLYVANSGSGNVTVVDTASMTPIGILRVGVAPQKMAVAPNGKLLVTNKGSDTVTVINTMSNTIAGTIRVGKGPTDVKMAPNGVRAYVSNRSDGTISIVDINSMAPVHVTDALPRSSPIGLAVRP